MPSPFFEVASGVINGVNRDFQTSVVYEPGSLRVWTNGLLGRRDLDDGFVETGPRDFRMNEAPVVEDVIQVFFRV